MNQVTPTEKAQIVVQFANGNTIFRFSSSKKAEKEYKALCSAWQDENTSDKQYEVNGDMFIGTVDLYQIVSVCLVDHAKRAKFVPIQ